MLLLFQNNNNPVGENTRDEHVEAFAETLNTAYKQFQKLWEAYKELLDKRNESESSNANVQNIAKDADVECSALPTATKRKIVLEEKSISPAKEGEVDCDRVTARISESEESSGLENSQTFQIFSQDFCTQGLEESFVQQNKSPLQEIQNLTPNRAKSPVFGSKKGKARAQPSPTNSPTPSDKSVVILSNPCNEKSSNIEDRSISNAVLDSNETSRLINSPIQISSPVLETSLTPTSKNIKKWRISTTQNVNTDVIVGTNKKLKQSKLFVTTEKVTDLSTCDDVYDSKSADRDHESKKRDVKKPNFTQTNKNVLEDSVIQGSPEQEKSVSKTRQRTTKRNKNAGTFEQGFNNDENTKQDQVSESINCDVSQADTDMTIFDPRIASTQYSILPCHSKSLTTGKSPIKDKPNLLKRIDPQEEGGNDSNVIDETMFEEFATPSDSRSQKKLSLGKIGKSKKLSLKKSFKASRNPERVSSDKETSGAEISGEALKTAASPPRKKFAPDNYHVVPRKKNASPTYAYKGSPVRKQAERALLNGWSCLECQKYYEAIGLSGEELQKRKNQCSRHRSKFNEKKATQKDYWDPDFSSSYHSTMWSDD